MSKNILKALPELQKAGIISDDVASNIQTYYQKESDKSQNRLFIVFGILGAILVGLGIILIIAHNWDDLSKRTKTALAFLPLIIGQIICGYALMKQSRKPVWKESTSAFLFFTVGASISLISQIYNIPGNLSSFLLTWMLLCLPVVYVMKSSITSLLVLAGITFYACETNYWNYSSAHSYEYWLVLALLLPHYISLLRNKSNGNFLIFHNWLLPLSVIICLGTLSQKAEELMFISYISLFGLLYIIGNTPQFKTQSMRNNAYTLLGSAGTIILLLTLSFDWFWNDLATFEVEILQAPEFYTLTVITILALALLIRQRSIQSWKRISFMEIAFILFIPIFIIGISSPLLAMIAVNLLAFALGLMTIRKGSIQNHLGILNYGLLIITALVMCRFFDTNISFIIRGLLFIMVGAGFFTANYLMLKKRRKNEE